MYLRYILIVLTIYFSSLLKAQNIDNSSYLKDTLNKEGVIDKLKKDNLMFFIVETYKNSALLYEGKLPEKDVFFVIANNQTTGRESLMSIKDLNNIPFNKITSITFIKEDYVRALYGEAVGRYGVFKIKYE